MNLDKKKLYLYKEAFNIFDVRQTGQINRDDLHSVLAVLHISPSSQDLQNLFKKYSTTEGKIKYQDFLKCVYEMRYRSDKNDVLQEAFENINEETSTTISVEKLKDVLMTKGEPFSQQEMEKFLNEADPGKTGQVIYKDVIKLLLK